MKKCSVFVHTIPLSISISISFSLCSVPLFLSPCWYSSKSFYLVINIPSFTFYFCFRSFYLVINYRIKRSAVINERWIQQYPAPELHGKSKLARDQRVDSWAGQIDIQGACGEPRREWSATFEHIRISVDETPRENTRPRRRRELREGSAMVARIPWGRDPARHARQMAAKAAYVLRLDGKSC